MMVNVPIDLIDERCLNCPELDIQDDGGTVIHAAAILNTMSWMVHNLKCAHLSRCQILLRSRKEHASE